MEIKGLILFKTQSHTTNKPGLTYETLYRVSGCFLCLGWGIHKPCSSPWLFIFSYEKYKHFCPYAKVPWVGVHKTSIFLNGNLNVDFFFKQYLLDIFIVSHKHSVLQ